MALATFDTTYNTANITLSNGNLTLANRVASSWFPARATLSFVAGKIYFEVTCNTSGGTATQVGVSNTSLANNNNYLGSNAYSLGYQSNGTVSIGGAPVNTIAAWTSGDVLCIAFDVANQKVWFRKNGGSWDNTTHDPATNTGGYSCPTMFTGAVYPAACTFSSTDQMTANFGATAFAQTIPSGFVSVNGPTTANLTQIAAEQWLNANAQAQLTQVAIEQWALAGTGTGTQAIATIVALEQWAVVAAAQAAQSRVMILA